MKLKVACKFITDLNSSDDRYIEFKLLLEEDIMKLDLDDYIEDEDGPNCLTDETMFDYECMEIHNRFHKIEYRGNEAIYSRVTGIEINCEDDNIKCLLNLLNDYGFDNFSEIEQKLRDRFNFRESFKFRKRRRNRKFGKKVK